MNFYKWRLKWDETQGIDPTSIINNDQTRIEPIFAAGNETDPSTFYYAKLVKGAIDLSHYGDFFMEQVTPEEVLTEAIKLDANATLTEDGIIFSPKQNPLI